MNIHTCVCAYVQRCFFARMHHRVVGRTIGLPIRLSTIYLSVYLSSIYISFHSSYATPPNPLPEHACAVHTGFTLDDCSAEGVFHLESGKPLTKAVNREVPVDDWVFWNMYVGCQNLTFQLDFQTSDSFTAPLLVIRKKRLPLMLEESMKFFDYYHGLTRHSLKQSIRVEPCMYV